MGKKLHGRYGGVNPVGGSIAFAPSGGEEQLERWFAGTLTEEDGIVFGYHGVEYHTPENRALVDKLLEGECGAYAHLYNGITTGSGMSAIYLLVLSACAPGKALIYSAKVYGCTFVAAFKIFPTLGIPTYRVDHPNDERAWERAAQEAKNNNHDIGLFFAETPSNPLAETLLIREFAKLGNKFGGITAIDNTLCTYHIQRPFFWDVDVVAGSASKGLNGRSTELGGYLLAKKEVFKNLAEKDIFHTMRPVMGVCVAKDFLENFDGVKKRIRRHCENACILADWLVAQEDFVEKVYYPTIQHEREQEIVRDQMSGYGGPLLSFEIRGDGKKAREFVDALGHAVVMVHICDYRYTLVNCSGRTSHAGIPEEARKAAGITPNLIRVSPSAEDEGTFREKILSDFKQAFEKVFRES